MAGWESWGRARTVQGRRMGAMLVDEVADFGKDALAEFDAQQTRAGRLEEGGFKSLENVVGKIGLAPEQAQQRGAVGWKFVVAG